MTLRSKKSRQREQAPRPNLRILILNWRCPRNPRAGGAEAFTFEIARRLVLHGNTVEWFAASFPGAKAEEELEGIQIVRAGRQWSVHWRAYRRYRRTVRARFDVVIDEVNTVPFFTPLWAHVPIVMLIHQLAREVWWYESKWPINAIGYLAEPTYLRVYRHGAVLTVSKSTQDDLLGLGFDGPIHIVDEGIEPIVDSGVARRTTPTFIYVGRIVPSKRIEHILRAFALFQDQFGSGTLWLVGSGSRKYRDSLADLAGRQNLGESVVFAGHLPTSDKHRMMAEAHALLVTSVREGWGLVVIEANACGTPAVVYDVPGLRDSVRDELTGLIVRPVPEALFAAMRRLITEPLLYASLAERAKEYSTKFSFDSSADFVEEKLEELLASDDWAMRRSSSGNPPTDSRGPA